MSLEFFLTSLIVVVLPGTGVIYTLAIGLGRGFRASLAAAVGCTLGIVPAALASIIGLAALLHTSALAFQVIKYLGVLYLFYMAWGIVKEGGAMEVNAEKFSAGHFQIAMTGTLINVLNPKLSLFFLAFLPQFLPAGTGNAGLGTGQAGRRLYGDDLCGLCRIWRLRCACTGLRHSKTIRDGLDQKVFRDSVRCAGRQAGAL